MVCDGELILIDMGDASVGDPVIDLLGSYQIMRLVTQRSGGAERYTGMSDALLSSVWDVFIHEYTGITDENELADTDEKRTRYKYIVTEYRTVEPSETRVLDDFGDSRLTVISCTDDGKQRQVVVGILKDVEETSSE